MPTNTETLNKKLYRYLSKYKPKPLDTDGEVTPLEDEADVFKFTFTVDGESYGTAFASVDDDTKLSLYYGDDVGESPKWLDFVEELKIWKNLNGFGKWEAKDMDQLQGDMTRRKHMRNKDKIAEGYYPMGKKASYSDSIPSVKIVIEHSRTIEEGEQRYRNINRIFLENQLGERYLLDTKKPGIARVYARHIAEGGKVNDDRWSHIGSLCEEYQKMAGFVRATRNGQFNESAQQLVNEGLAHYESLRESLSRLTGKRGYNAYFENWTPQLMEDNVEENNLNELFVQETLDPRIESVMPILNRIHKKVSESVIDKEMNKLAEWADSLTEAEGESIQSNNPIGIPESDDYDDEKDKIRHLMQKYHWSRQEAMEHLHYNDHDDSDWEGSRFEKTDESALQASFGIDKYGEDGMKELQRLGRIHASKAKVAKAKAKYTSEDVAEEVDLGQYDAVKSTHKGETTPEQEKEFRKKVQAYGKELEQRQKEKSVAENLEQEKIEFDNWLKKASLKDLWDEASKWESSTPYIGREYEKLVARQKELIGPAAFREKEINDRLKGKLKKYPNITVPMREEGLDANQKRVGQLGPTEKVKNNNIGKLVGPNENFINQVDQAVVSEEDEMAEGEHTQHAMRGRNPGANEFEHDFEPEDKVGNIHDKISKMLKRLEKPKHEPNMKDTDIGSTVLESHQLNEGLMDSLNGMIAKIKAMPGIQKYIQLAQSKKQALVQALQHSANGKDLVANIQQAVGGQQAVAEGWGQKLGGAVMSSMGGGLMAGGADLLMKAYLQMGKPDLSQMTGDQQGGMLFLTSLIVLGALALFAGGHQMKQGIDNDAQQMREGQEDLDAILRIIKK